MSLVCVREAFVLKHVSQMSTALCANDLHSSHAMAGVDIGGNPSFVTLVKCWPATPTAKLGLRTVEWIRTTSTNKMPFFGIKFVVFSSNKENIGQKRNFGNGSNNYGVR